MKLEKRDGRIVDFEIEKISKAVEKAMAETEEGVDKSLAGRVAKKVMEECMKLNEDVVHIEVIQDCVEMELMNSDRKDVAKRYILYREERNKVRNLNVKSKYTLLSDDFLANYKHKPDPFPYEVGKFVYYRTYSRPIPEEGRRERWWETVARVVDFNIGLQISAMKRQGIRITFEVMSRLEQEAREVYDLMYNLKLFPSGRSLWVGNTPSSFLYPMSNFNCSFFVMDNLKKYSELMFILMLGTGAGISVERKYVKKLPKVNTKIEVIHKNYVPVPRRDRKEHTELHQKSSNVLELVVGDSKFGWSKAVDMYLEIISSRQYADIEFILINYDSVRPAGERLKTFGGFASGHTALSIMFDKINNLVRAKGDKKAVQWQTLKPIDCLDIATIIAENVVSGGTRRSAEIIFCDADEKEVIEAKGNIYYQNEQGGWKTNTSIEHRTLSNNTVIYNKKPTKEVLHAHFQKMIVSGEPAICNLEEMKRRRPDAQGTNPCFTRGMKLLTSEGYREIGSLDGQEVYLVNKDGRVTKGKVWCSGEKEIYEVRFLNKPSITCTKDHRFMLIDGSECEAQDLRDKRIMPYLFHNEDDLDKEYIKYGFLQGDGNLGRLDSEVHRGLEVNIGEKDEDVRNFFGLEGTTNRKEYINGYNEVLKELGFSSNLLPLRKLPTTIDNWSLKEKKSFLKGLFSANGSVINTGRITLKSTCYELIQGVKNLLWETIGVDAYIATNPEKEVEFENGKYLCKESYDLNIGKYEDRVKFYNEIGFIQVYKMDRLKEKLIVQSPLVVNVVATGRVEKVYDFNEPETHWGIVEGVIAHNCGEILLRDRGVCNLTEVNVYGFVREDGTLDLEGLLRAQELSARMGYRMATIELELHEWNLVHQEDRLVGTSLTGVMDAFNALSYETEDIKVLLQQLREKAVNAANNLADYLQMNRPKLVTTVKPSGTISQLPTVSSGMHYSHSPYYIRRVRVGINDPIVAAMDEMGFKYIEESMNKVVYEFPVKAPEGKTKYDVGAIEQLEMYKLFMENYVTHNASNTIHVRPNEWQEVEDWVYENWDSLVGVTFLSLDDSFYPLMPYESITKEQYEEMIAKTPKFNPAILSKYENFDDDEDVDLGSDCDSGVCPVR